MYAACASPSAFKGLAQLASTNQTLSSAACASLSSFKVEACKACNWTLVLCRASALTFVVSSCAFKSDTCLYIYIYIYTYIYDICVI